MLTLLHVGLQCTIGTARQVDAVRARLPLHRCPPSACGGRRCSNCRASAPTLSIRTACTQHDVRFIDCVFFIGAMHSFWSVSLRWLKTHMFPDLSSLSDQRVGRTRIPVCRHISGRSTCRHLQPHDDARLTEPPVQVACPGDNFPVMVAERPVAAHLFLYGV